MINPSLRAELERIYQNLLASERRAKARIAGVHPKQRRSATNLAHYLTLRLENLRPLQDALHDAGLSSLASAEGHVLWQMQAVLQRLGVDIPTKDIAKVDASAGNHLLQQHAHTLFGPKTGSTLPHLMVTFDSGLADDYTTVKALIKAGMQIARINCAHDNPSVWSRMIAHVRKASKATGLPCKVYLDLAGPKVRTELLGKGQKKGRVKLKEQALVYLAEADALFDKKEKVLG